MLADVFCDRYETIDTRVALRGGCRTNPGEPVRSFLRVGSENARLVGHAHVVCREVVAQASAGVALRERAAAFPKRHYATASTSSGSRATSSWAAGFRRQAEDPSPLSLPRNRASLFAAQGHGS